MVPLRHPMVKPYPLEVALMIVIITAGTVRADNYCQSAWQSSRVRKQIFISTPRPAHRWNRLGQAVATMWKSRTRQKVAFVGLRASTHDVLHHCQQGAKNKCPHGFRPTPAPWTKYDWQNRKACNVQSDIWARCKASFFKRCTVHNKSS